MIGVFVDKDSSTGVLLEVNCETDFVARTEKFKTLVAQLTETVARATIVPGSVEQPSTDPSSSFLKKYLLQSNQLDPFKEKLVTAISQLGENIIVKKALIVQPHPHQQDSSLSPISFTAYAHSVAGSSNFYEGVFLGKYGTLLAYTSPAEEDDVSLEETMEVKREAKAKQVPTEEGVDIVEEDALERESFDTEEVSQEALSRLLCQHIVGFKPLKLRSTPEERQELARLRNIRREAGNHDEDEDSDALLDQRFLLDPKITVRQLLKQKNMRVIDFVRFECGVNED